MSELLDPVARLDEQRAKDLARNDALMRASDRRAAHPPAMRVAVGGRQFGGSTFTAVAVLALAGLVAGCASEDTTERSDVHCVAPRQVPITIGGEVYVVDAGCSAWIVGPTRRQREEFERAHGRQPGSGS